MANYINNNEFIKALTERKHQVAQALLDGKELPQISKYICECILHICNRLSYSPNFINYSFKEDMIDEAIFSCIINVDKFETNIISIRQHQDTGTEPIEGVKYIRNLVKLRDIVLTGVTSGATAVIKSYNKETKRIIAKTTDDSKLLQKEDVFYIDEEGNRIEFTLDGITYSNAFAFFTQCAWNAYVNRIKLENLETITKASIFQSASTEFLDIQDHDSDENFNNGFTDFVKNSSYLTVEVPIVKKPKKKKPANSIENLL